MSLDPESDRRLRALFARLRAHAIRAPRGKRVVVGLRVVMVSGRVSPESYLEPFWEFPLDDGGTEVADLDK